MVIIISRIWVRFKWWQIGYCHSTTQFICWVNVIFFIFKNGLVNVAYDHTTNLDSFCILNNNTFPNISLHWVGCKSFTGEVVSVLIWESDVEKVWSFLNFFNYVVFTIVCRKLWLYLGLDSSVTSNAWELATLWTLNAHPTSLIRIF